MQQEWAQVKPRVDPNIHANVSARLATQQQEAVWWRDAWVLYLQRFTKLPVPAPFKKPDRNLEVVKRWSIFISCADAEDATE